MDGQMYELVRMKHDEEGLHGFYAPEHLRHYSCAAGEIIDVPKDVVWRAEAHGFHKTKEKPKSEKKVETPSKEEVITTTPSDILDQNAKTVIAVLDKYDEKEMKALLDAEEKGKNRIRVVNVLKEKLGID